STCSTSAAATGMPHFGSRTPTRQAVLSATTARPRASQPRRRREARDPRPLCGVPVGIKDLLSATEGVPTTQGSAAFGDWIADHDSAHVRRLRAAGAIVVGKTNTPELGCGGNREHALRR